VGNAQIVRKWEIGFVGRESRAERNNLVIDSARRRWTGCRSLGKGQNTGSKATFGGERAHVEKKTGEKSVRERGSSVREGREIGRAVKKGVKGSCDAD